MIFLSDDIITLRAVEPTDLDDFYRWENDTELWDCTPTIAPFSRDLLARYIAAYTADIYADKQLRMMITLTATGQTVGTLDLTDFDPVNRRVAVGVLVDKPFTRKGYATRAIELAAAYAEKRLGIHQLWATIAADNAASIGLFTKVGFKRYGRLRSWIRRGRAYCDAYIMQRLFE